MTALLLIEDNPEDGGQLKEALDVLSYTQLKLTRAGSLAEARVKLSESRFDLIFVDLELPDSEGVQTFTQLQSFAPETPVLVLTSSEEDTAGKAAVTAGALDYLNKRDLTPAWLARSIRYALERSRLQRELFEARQRRHRSQELEGVERLSRGPGTNVTSALYSCGALRETLPEAFNKALESYHSVLDLALERRTHRGEDRCSEAIIELGDTLGFLRASPRDVIDIHIAALNSCFAHSETPRANAYLEEGRLTLLELMGNLVGFYRTYYTPTQKKGGVNE